VAIDQSRVPEAKAKTRIEVGTSSWQPPNQTVQFPKPDNSVSSASRQKKALRTTAIGMALAPRWCPPGHTPIQRMRIQWMRAQKMREEVAEKERDEHFSTIESVIPMKQEWKVKEKAVVPTPVTFDDDMDLLDDDEALLIKDGSPPPTGMDINMVFMLPAEFRGVVEEIAQMCLS
jgi:hypothetical protein